MRYLVPAFFFVGIAAVFACSSDDPQTPADAGVTVAPTGDGGDAGDDDDTTPACEGAGGYDCVKLTAHRKKATCPKFDEARAKKDCEDENCATPLTCAAEQKAFGDCLLTVAAVCEDGQVSNDVPAACSAENDALFECIKNTL